MATFAALISGMWCSTVSASLRLFINSSKVAGLA
jgi:hypothetical protein